MPYITEECLKKLDTKQQTSTLLALVWRDSASEEAFTLMASIGHTLMVQHRMAVPRVRQVVRGRESSGVCPGGGLGCCFPRGAMEEVPAVQPCVDNDRWSFLSKPAGPVRLRFPGLPGSKRNERVSRAGRAGCG